MATTHHQHLRSTHTQYDISDTFFANKEDIGKLFLRLTIGGLMLIHGITKLLYGTEQIEGILNSVGLPSFFAFGVILGEVLGPVMLIIGFKVRIGAALVAFNMLMAVLLVHSADLTKINEVGGWMLELNALYLLGAVAIILLGSGQYAVTKGRGPLD